MHGLDEVNDTLPSLSTPFHKDERRVGLDASVEGLVQFTNLELGVCLKAGPRADPRGMAPVGGMAAHDSPVRTRRLGFRHDSLSMHG